MTFTVLNDDHFFYSELCLRNLEKFPYIRYLLNQDPSINGTAAFSKTKNTLPKDEAYYRLMKNIQILNFMNVISVLAVLLDSQGNANEILEDEIKAFMMDLKDLGDSPDMKHFITYIQDKVSDMEETYRIQRNKRGINIENYFTDTPETVPLFNSPPTDPIDDILK